MSTYTDKSSEDEIRRAALEAADEREEDKEQVFDAPEISAPEVRQEAAAPNLKKDPAKTIRFYSVAVIVFIILFIVITNCFVRVEVFNRSMEPAYYEGDIIWANRWRKPFYDCVVIMENPYFEKKPNEPEIILKRVMGFSGDEFWIDESNNLLRRSEGVEAIIQEGISEERIYIIFNNSEIFTGYNQVYLVEEDCIFVLGDNFNMSEDSRFYGGVHKSAVRGVIY